MLKRERLERILQMVNTKGIVKAQDIINSLDVSDMTVRRDLDELEKSGKLVRVHGGAQSIHYSIDVELTHIEKSTVHIDEKAEIAKLAAQKVHDNDSIFLGPGTTIELMASMIESKPARIITNSLPVFEILKNKFSDALLLTGGSYRSSTGCFIGVMTNNVLENMNFNAAFFSCNGLADTKISTSTMEEGEAQRIALNHSHYRYLLADGSKFNREDFYTYYHLYNIDTLITDSNVAEHVIERYAVHTKIEQAGKETLK